MTLWNTGYFLVVKTWRMKLMILFMAVLALWGPSIAPALRRNQRQAPN
jgi:hypothetical protein